MTNQNPTNTCGCGNHAKKPVDPQRAEVREEIKLVPAEGSVETTGTCGCGDETGQCSCGHHQTCDCPPGECTCAGHNHGAANTQTTTETTVITETAAPADQAADGCCGGHATGKDNHNADIDGAVRTVDEAENHRPGATWNDGNVPAADGEATASGQGNNEADNLN